jgi:peptidoglycan/xylan/chitin deacetylase (PgdA/CDA1 family)
MNHAIKFMWVVLCFNAHYTASSQAFASANVHEIPILCYHQVRDWTVSDSKSARTIIISPARFMEHMKVLSDNGYHAVLPAQVADHFQTGAQLPSKPVMITFDDGSKSQFTAALPILNAFGFKAVFFIMTVALGKEKYMNATQIKDLVKQGHIIGCHTWDHHNVTTYKATDWRIQIQNPTIELQKITGKPIQFFAYPYGAWDVMAVTQLKNNGYVMAFQLSGLQHAEYPAFTVRRIIADSHWSGQQLVTAMKKSFR